MYMTRSVVRLRQRGFTLIELIIFIVVVGVGMAGILQVMNTVVKSSADPMVRKQSLAIAESVLEEIMLQNYNDPDGTNTSESDRTNWDNVGDYHGKTNADLGISTDLSAYVVGIDVRNDATVIGTSTRPARRITVTVSHLPEVITLIGYRACYGEIDSITGLNTCPP
jgi:MSHA pilin protein MshD